MVRSVEPERVRTAELVAALGLATDLGIGLPLEHGFKTTLVAMRIAERLGVDPTTERQTYFGCLLFYGGCTADAEVQARLFPEGALLTHWTPVMFGSTEEGTRGVLAALAAGDAIWPARALRAVRRLPGAVRGYQQHVAALCQVTELLAEGLGLPTDISEMLGGLTERWDGHGPLGRARGSQVPLALRIVQVARDATFQATLHDRSQVARILMERAGKAFDPDVVDVVLREQDEILAPPTGGSLWEATMQAEPPPYRILCDAEIDDALLSVGAFTDLVSPAFTGHSLAVAELAGRAAELAGYSRAESAAIRRAGLVHDLGRVGVPFSVWQKPGKLTTDEWEKVRLHPYHTERLLNRSPFLTELGAIAGCHHERLDGSGYHRGLPAAGLNRRARLLAAADAYCTKTEFRPHREPLTPQDAAEHLRAEATVGRLDPDCVGSVLTTAGHRQEGIPMPGGLTSRERQTLALLAKGMVVKQVARTLGVTPKTADHYVQRVYAKIGVSTRAAAAVYAMQNGIVTWENTHSTGGPADS